MRETRRRRAGGAVPLAALFVAALALRPQIVGAGPLVPAFAADLAITHAAAGLIGAIPVLCMGLFAPAAGALAGRWGLRAAMTACLAGVAGFGLLRAAVPGAPLALALTLPIGIAVAVAGALLPIAVKTWFPHRPGFASGICTTGLNLGAAASSAVAVPVATASGGWRVALALFSAVSVALGAGWLALSRGTRAERSRERRPSLPLRRPIVWLIVLVFGLNSIVYYGLVAWLADALQERGWSPAGAGAVLAVMGACALPGGLLVPWLADRAGSRRQWLAAAASVLALMTLGFATAPAAGMAWAVFAGMALGAIFPLCLTLCLDVAREPAGAGAAAALMFLAGYPLAALAPLGLGLLRDVTGAFSTSLWAIFAAALALLAACAPLTPARLRSL